MSPFLEMIINPTSTTITVVSTYFTLILFIQSVQLVKPIRNWFTIPSQRSTERALLMARESKSNRIKLMFANNTLTITANSEKGNINDEIEIQLVGKDLEIAFNATYIQDVMRVLDDECVYLNMNNAVTPCVIVPVEGEAFYYMILPVRLFTGA